MSKFIKVRGERMVATKIGTPIEVTRLAVTKRDGSSKTVVVDAPVATDADGWTLCSIRPDGRAAARKKTRASRRSSSVYCGYSCPVTHRRCCAANGPCHDCE